MNKRFLSAAAFALTLSASFAALSISPAQAAGGELHLYTFGDYFAPEVIKNFESKTGIKVTENDYDSNDIMHTKLAAGASGYDVALGGNWIIPQLIKEGLIEKSEPNTLPNYKNVRAEFKNVPWDDGRHYTVPFLWGTTGIAINTNKYKGPTDSWSLVFNPPAELKGEINSVPEMQDVINSVNFYKGLPLCSSKKEDLKVILDTLLAAKQNWKSMLYSVNDDMPKENYYATVNWNGATWRERQQVAAIKYVYPKEGLVSWSDSVFIVKGARNLENAKLFLDFIMSPEEAAKLSKFAGYDNSIEGSHAFLDKAFTESPEIVPPAGTKTTWAPSCSSEVLRDYGKIWEQVLK